MITPRKGIVLIEIIEEEEKKGDLYLARSKGTNFDKVRILGVGSEVSDLKKGDIVYAHKIWEPIEIGGKVAFISEKDIFATIEEKFVAKD